MSIGPFIPTPFSTPVVSPEVSSAYRRFPYLSPSEYVNAPTAVGTNNLIPNGNAQDNLQVLADTIMRASGWMDQHCFHTADGTLAASPSTEAAWIRPKLNGSMVLTCKYRPILEVDAIALGCNPGELSSLTTAPPLSIGLKTITIPPVALGAPAGDFLPFPLVGYGGQLYVVWQYVNGYPHTFLAADAEQGAASITVGPIYGVYPNTQLTIHDGVSTETITVGSIAGDVITLAAGTTLANAHTLPDAPDSIRVSALPWAIEQACISMTSCLIKLRGTRALTLPTVPGAAPSKEALADAGGLEDYEVACKLLKPFTTVTL